MIPDNSRTFTNYGWGVCLWILIVSFQYGFHISALNQIQAVLTCKVTDPGSGDSGSGGARVHYGLPTCIPMSDATFSILTSVYTIGGLLGSLFANVIMDRWGRKGAVRASAITVVGGAGMMGVAGSLTPLVIGRIFAGVGAGIGICVGPIFLSEIAPPRIKGAIGVLTQFSIVMGIMVTQAMGLKLATPHEWRIVLLFSFALAAAMLLAGPLIVESPTWLARHNMTEQKSLATRWLYGVRDTPSRSVSEDATVDPLLGDPDFDAETQRARGASSSGAAISVPHLLGARELRKPLTIVCFSMLVQQLSGVNAVLYYSNDILSKALPDMGPYISLGITIVNVLMTFPPIFLIEKIGRRQLLTYSASGAVISLVGVGLGLDVNWVGLASFAIIAFIASFAIGVGPVPFVMIPEVSPVHAVSALSSVGLSLNWVANFIVGLVFLPLRNMLAGGDPLKEGRVFYVFSLVMLFCTFVLLKVYRG
ncbi:hypothetical protein NLI96_g6940 [Meripilus lineatus]|uniref:Major facilitator superfamily (MFS) profile domain-containing protein n=1 Tax=Meripilus lineatus TaxID=2056292 RepID=A0AAD5YFG9_9APHY|nr:hypothetical protein NLI96_g6940 [Physisporinus lineatus]